VNAPSASLVQPLARIVVSTARVSRRPGYRARDRASMK